MKRFYLSLNDANSLKKVSRQLGTYEYRLQQNAERFVYRLLDKGIATAKANVGKLGTYILFTREVDKDECGAAGLLIATDGAKLIREWYTDKDLTQKRSYQVSPLLLAEFGSGWLSNVVWDIEGVGQGTMPNSYQHAFDPDGWYWYDVAGVKQHSKGEKPTYPMHSAMVAMMMEIESTAREVFKG